MLGHIATWLYFLAAWAFIGGVAFRRWKERERADKAATEKQLERTKPATSDEHIWDVV